MNNINFQINFKVDCSKYKKNSNPEKRNLWISPKYQIFLETFSPLYKETCDFLIAIAEPANRTKYFHEYRLTERSLYAAASMNIKTSDILQILNNLSKTEIPSEVKDFIENSTKTFGKARLILKNKRYFIESKDSDIINFLNRHEVIRESHESIMNERRNFRILNKRNQDIVSEEETKKEDNLKNALEKIMIEEETNFITEEFDSIGKNHFEINPKTIEKIRKICIDIKYPLLEEYDFKNDLTNPDVNMILKLKKPARPYQEKALSIMFSNGRARSGIIVLPCGAGKTLVGIMAASTIKKNTIVLCTSGVSVNQWYQEFKSWTSIKETNIVQFTSKMASNSSKMFDISKESGIIITTYSMMSFQGVRSKESEYMINEIKNVDWGLMILDEVQVIPAIMFRKILSLVKSHCKLGLTATLVREDNKIEDLDFLIGPKHYEANWLDLQTEGYLARVRCVEINCEMSTDFYSEYLRIDKSDKGRRNLLHVTNPNKFRICKSLVDYHEKQGDKILIFSDDLFSVKNYARFLGIFHICGEVGEQERLACLHAFRTGISTSSGAKINTLMMSKVGDTSLDLPNASVIIQISSHTGSRRQEAQRLGRILRPKPNSLGEYNAYFYSIVSKDTREMSFSIRRRKYLVDQGYPFKVINNLADIDIPISDTPEMKNKLFDYQKVVMEEVKKKNFRYDLDRKSKSDDDIENNNDLSDNSIPDIQSQNDANNESEEYEEDELMDIEEEI